MKTANRINRIKPVGEDDFRTNGGAKTKRSLVRRPFRNGSRTNDVGKPPPGDRFSNNRRTGHTRSNRRQLIVPGERKTFYRLPDNYRTLKPNPRRSRQTIPLGPTGYYSIIYSCETETICSPLVLTDAYVSNGTYSAGRIYSPGDYVRRLRYLLRTQ